MVNLKEGKRISVWIPPELDNLVDCYRRKLGISKSGFYRTAVLRYLEEISKSELIRQADLRS